MQVSCNPKILYIIEHHARELNYGKLLQKRFPNLKFEFCSIAYFLFLKNFSSFNLIIIPFIPSENSTFNKYIKKYLQAGGSVMCFPWEQELGDVGLEYRRKAYKSFSNLNMKIVCWTHEFANFLKNCGYHIDDIVFGERFNTSIMRNKIFEQKETNNFFKTKKNNKKFVFAPVNYGWADTDETLFQYRINGGYDAVKAKEHREYATKCRNSFFKEIIRFCKLNKDVDVIVRPHPSEKISKYKYELKKNNGKFPCNLIISNKGDPLVLSAKCFLLITSWSSLALDRALLGGASVLFTPYPRPKWLEVEWNKNIFNIKNLRIFLDDDLIKFKPNKKKFIQYSKIIDTNLDLNKYINKKIPFNLKISLLRLRFMVYNLKNILKFFLFKYTGHFENGLEEDFIFNVNKEELK